MKSDDSATTSMCRRVPTGCLGARTGAAVRKRDTLVATATLAPGIARVATGGAA